MPNVFGRMPDSLNDNERKTHDKGKPGVTGNAKERSLKFRKGTSARNVDGGKIYENSDV